MSRYTLRPARSTALKRAKLARESRDTAMGLARQLRDLGWSPRPSVEAARIYNRRVVQCLREAGEAQL
jgi:hypothetical protein